MQDDTLRKWDTIATMETNLWTITIKLFPDKTPKTCENFIWLCNSWYYEWVIFHRVIPNFMIQWWDPTGTWMWWKSFFGEEFEDEFTSELTHKRWALSMANAGPDTNWSQFFIVQAPETKYLDWNHSVFWQVVDWMDVVDRIASQKRDRDDKPFHDVTIDKIIISVQA